MNNKEFNGLVSFTAQPLNDAGLEELNRMADLLKKVGVSLETTRKENAGLGLEYDYITIKLDEEKYKGNCRGSGHQGQHRLGRHPICGRERRFRL